MYRTIPGLVELREDYLTFAVYDMAFSYLIRRARGGSSNDCLEKRDNDRNI